MNKSIETRVLKLGEYIIDNKSTIRETAKFFGISHPEFWKNDG